MSRAVNALPGPPSARTQRTAQRAGNVWASVGIIYVMIMFLADFDTTVVVVGALVIALIAVTSP